jgi:Protein of unknown function (DUF3995)
MGSQAAIIAYPLALILLGLAMVHLYWGIGGYWPGTDEASLVEHVVGRTPGMRAPTLLACVIVAVCLAGVAGFVIVKGLVGPLSPAFAMLVKVGLYAAALVFILRGAAGYLPGIFDYARGTPFYSLNMSLYSPLCLAIGVALIVLNQMRISS